MKKHFGVMIDCSRNAIMKPAYVKHMTDLLSELGYNTLMLYIEDTYEVDDNPYFGHLRGRYTREELKEMDRYAQSKGMELIPCIQTLAHLGHLFRWQTYSQLNDIDDILLVGDERVYELIDKMFFSLSQSLTTRTVNIGMDEAHHLGLGKYLDQHGYCDRVQILLTHLNRISEIAKKYGFELIMWGDMFYRLLNGGYDAHSTPDPEQAKKISAQIPDNVHLIYWDYYSQEKSHYDAMIRGHQMLDPNTWFAGGFWTWGGFTPFNYFSLGATKAAVTSCNEHGVSDMFFTMWGDNGSECPRLGVLPCIFYASMLRKGVTDEAEIKKAFEEKYQIAFDDFMLLSLGETPNGTGWVKNPDKYMLYNDPFIGIFDSTVREGDSELYRKAAEKLALHENHPTFGYFFTTQRLLCEILADKYDLGVRTRAAYVNQDRHALTALLEVYDRLPAEIEAFYRAFCHQWDLENKPNGFDAQDIRIGGLLMRIRHCRERLQDYLEGKIENIPELEEPVLDSNGIDGTNLKKEPLYVNWWSSDVSVNSI